MPGRTLPKWWRDISVFAVVDASALDSVTVATAPGASSVALSV